MLWSLVYRSRKDIAVEERGGRTTASRSDVLGVAGDNGGSAVQNTSLGIC